MGCLTNATRTSPVSLLTLAATLLCACGGNVDTSTRDAGASDGAKGQDAGPILTHEAGPSPADATAESGDTGPGRPDVTDAAANVDSFVVTPLGLTAVPLFACQPSEYAATVTIGGTQTFQLLLDTGSATLGVASSMCPSCGVTPTYTPGPSAQDQVIPTQSFYDTGSWMGEVYQDTVSMGGGATTTVDLAAIESQSQFFGETACNSTRSSSTQGIIGFAPARDVAYGTNAFFDQLMTNTTIPNVFATELCDTDGTLWLGGFDPSFTTASPQYVPLTPSSAAEGYYGVNLVSILVNGVSEADAGTDAGSGVSVPVATTHYPDSIVDTGTSTFVIPTSTADGLAAAISASPAFQSIIGATWGNMGAGFFSGPGNCLSLTQTKATLDAMLPVLTLVFGDSPGVEVQALATESYLQQVEGMWCSTLDPSDPQPGQPSAAILGNPVLRSNVVIFDRANNRIGFAPHTACN